MNNDNIDMSDPYNIVFHELMTMGFHLRVAEGEIPVDDFINAFADFLVINCFGIGQQEGNEEAMALLAIQRMKKTLNDWKLGNTPFEESNGTEELN